MARSALSPIERLRETDWIVGQQDLRLCTRELTQRVTRETTAIIGPNHLNQLRDVLMAAPSVILGPHGHPAGIMTKPLVVERLQYVWQVEIVLRFAVSQLIARQHQARQGCDQLLRRCRQSTNHDQFWQTRFHQPDGVDPLFCVSRTVAAWHLALTKANADDHTACSLNYDGQVKHELVAIPG